MNDDRSLAEIKTLHHISQALRSNDSIAGKLREVIAAAVQFTGADHALALLLSKDRQFFDVVASSEKEAPPAVFHIPVETSAIGQHLVNSQPLELAALTVRDLSYGGAGLAERFKPGDEKLLLPGCEALLLVPLSGQMECIGGLLLFFVEHPAPLLSDTATDLLETLVSQAAIVIEDSLLFAAASRMTEQMRLVNQVSLEIAAIHDLDTILNILPNRLTETFGYYHASVGIIGPSSIEMYEASQRSRAVGSKRFHIPIESKGIVPWVARHGVAHLANDTRQDSFWIPGKGLEASRSEVTVPLVYRDRTIGIIDVQSEHINAFDRDDMSVLEALAGQLAVAIENVRLFDENIHQRRTAETLSRVSRLVGVLLDVRQISQTVLDELKKLLPFEAALIALYENNVFRIVHQIGYGPRDEAGIGWLVGDSPLFYRIVHYRELVLIPDTATDHLWQRGGPPSVRSWLGVPLISRERPTGVLAIASSSPNVYTLSDSQILFAFANQIAGTLDNAQLFERSEQRERETRALYEVTRLLVSLDQETIPLSVMQHLGEALLFDIAGLLVGGVPSRLVICARRSVAESAVQELETRLCEMYSALSRDPIDQDVLERRTFLTGPFPEAKPLEAVPARFSVPLLAGRNIIGILEVAKADPTPYADSEVRALYILANLTATALENARLYQALMARAENLQELVNELAETDKLKSGDGDRSENSADHDG